MTTTRFAPSPTGYLHVGNLRTALLNWLVARKAGGRFLLRFDDTDPERSKAVYAEAAIADLDWLGLTPDAVLHQSDRLALYADAADRLRASGHLYECFETAEELELRRRAQRAAGRPPVYDRAALKLDAGQKDALRATRPGHWRFRLDGARTAWTDGILGDVSIDSSSVSDPVLIRGDGQVLYTLASVVDDIDLRISDVVRGADHVTNTATQIQIMAALGAAPPRFAHHSLLTGPAGEALSKRLGTLALRDLRASGVEPMALLSLLARLGTADPVEVIATREALVAGFDPARFGTAPTKLDPADLPALTARYLHGCEADEMAPDLAAAGVPEAQAAAFWEAVRGNVAVRGDIAQWWNICRDPSESVVDPEDAEFVAEAMALLPDAPWDGETWGRWTAAVKAATGRKGRGLFRPLRLALTGREAGPDMAALMPFLAGRH